ncbi:hypothetical protein DdX_21059 [Ditylenchus destructor]|uniref:Uncharacterized protein n=1 Tax=Ditylenchus destructor TaxID=166010 RepID=A0AAD4MGC0_9BILA|nr:hypothetical protein DdX_21059 [Ditylenchus destructor]
MPRPASPPPIVRRLHPAIVGARRAGARTGRARPARCDVGEERDRRSAAAYRDTVVLVAGQQLTHAEAAAILGIAEATVSWRMHEVRRMLAGRPDAGI